MKAATGELSLTLITIVAVGVVLALFMTFKDDIGNLIKGKVEGVGDTGYVEVVDTDLG